ncbi:uncharacterized protein SAPINGB_P004594 [Magnusiomyces paraingens]|uniref:Uncharacterized protein n=1 Tax=Magnusiomyces paraingens TaxID=2606893 RepID=A0A5E8BVG2_9ASCO|nr:uncharacterized protein SAPINGB_P004594 [Saprochaete ingens]VVT55433.1 unnamed protein product [Saprochaete ingens]
MLTANKIEPVSRASNVALNSESVTDFSISTSQSSDSALLLINGNRNFNPITNDSLNIYRNSLNSVSAASVMEDVQINQYNTSFVSGSQPNIYPITLNQMSHVMPYYFPVVVNSTTGFTVSPSVYSTAFRNIAFNTTEFIYGQNTALFQYNMNPNRVGPLALQSFSNNIQSHNIPFINMNTNSNESLQGFIYGIPNSNIFSDQQIFGSCQQFNNFFTPSGVQQNNQSNNFCSHLLSSNQESANFLNVTQNGVFDLAQSVTANSLLTFDGTDVRFFLESFENEATRANIPISEWVNESKRCINLEIWKWLNLESVADWDDLKKILKARYSFPNFLVTRSTFYEVLDKILSFYNLDDSFSANGNDIADGILQVRVLIKAAEKRFGLAPQDYQIVFKKLCDCIPSFTFIMISVISDHSVYRWLAGKKDVNTELTTIHFRFLEALNITIPAFRNYISPSKTKASCSNSEKQSSLTLQK